MKMPLILAVSLLVIGGWLFWRALDDREFGILESTNERSAIAPEHIVGDLPRDVLDPFSSEDGSPVNANDPKDKLTFSNTMEWDPVIWMNKGLPPFFDISLDEAIHLPPFPANSSVRTKKELTLLHEYEKNFRTKKNLKLIGSEAPTLEGIRFGDHTYGEYINAKKYPQTAFLLRTAMKDVVIAALKTKEKYDDRPRPSVLDPSLSTVIAVPGHPPYPNGHAAEVYFIAYFLSELIPEKQKEFEKAALGVAIRREIAGVHYPSDTGAAALFARQFLDALKKNPEFAKHLEAAQLEWSPRQ